MRREPKHIISLRLDEGIYERLLRQSIDENRSLNFIITNALTQHVAEEQGEQHDQHANKSR